MSKRIRNAGALVDQLGLIKAQQADLEKQAKAIVDKLKSDGRSSIEGSTFRATISTSTRETLDSRKVRAILSAKQLAAVTVEQEVVTLKVSARTGVELAEVA